MVPASLQYRTADVVERVVRETVVRVRFDDVVVVPVIVVGVSRRLTFDVIVEERIVRIFLSDATDPMRSTGGTATHNHTTLDRRYSIYNT